LASLHSLSSMQNEWNWSQLLQGPLTKFTGKLWKIFWTQSFSLGVISRCLISLINEIFHSARILQLPSRSPDWVFPKVLITPWWKIHFSLKHTADLRCIIFFHYNHPRCCVISSACRFVNWSKIMKLILKVVKARIGICGPLRW